MFEPKDRIIPSTDTTFVASRVLRVVDHNERVLRAAPDGGGLVYEFDAAAQAKYAFRLVTEDDKPTWRRAVFGFDEGPLFVGWTNGERWNGWGKPYFSKREACRFGTHPYFAKEWGRVTLNDDDSFTVFDPGSDEENIVRPELVEEIPNHEDDPDETCPVYDFALGLAWNVVDRDAAIRSGQLAEWCTLMGEPPPMEFKVGDRLRFKAGATRPIGNWEFELGGQTGTVTVSDARTLAIRLDVHSDDLAEWDNQIVYEVVDEAELVADLPRWVDKV